MTDEEKILRKRFAELSDRSFSRGTYEHTDFLNLAQQSVLASMIKSGEAHDVALYGGAPNAERVTAVFGSEENCGYEYSPEIAVVKISPLSEKFGEELHHRDVLGSMLALGIKRELTGDIFTSGKTAYAITDSGIAPYIADNLKTVRHTDVKCEILASLPEGLSEKNQELNVISSSERLDCIISAVYNIPRSTAKQLFIKERVFICGAACTRPEAMPKAGDIVSVRGMGRFVYNGAQRETKKGRKIISVGIFS